MAVEALPKISLVLAAAGAVIFTHAVIKVYGARSSFYQKVKQGLPMPKWNPFFGHLLVVNDIFKARNLPPDIQRPELFRILSEDFDESESLYYVDLWPFISPLLLVSSPNYAIQACQQHDLGKPDDLVPFLHPIAGGNSIFTANGEDSKRARSLFSSGFNSSYVLNQTTHIVQEAEVFVQILRNYAKKGDIIQLDKVTLNYMMDVSGAMTLNTRLHCQQGNNALGSALQHTLGWHFLGELKNPVVRWSPLIRLIAWYNGQRMNRYISKVLHHRFEEMKRDGSELLPKRSAIDLALADYLSGAGKGRTTLDPNFEKWAVTQLRLFFFVGHDSTSPTICYCFYLLSKYPDALRKLRDEHDAVFGQDRSHLSKILCEKPHLLNQLTYTNAVLKETLRLYPPAGGFRAGAPGVYLYDTKGNKYPTEGTMVWVLHPSLQRNPLYWKDAHVFIPERWLVSPDDPLYPMKGAWRPFEFGKRDCLGQNLAMLDLRVSIAMLVREFDISDAYDEWDRMYPQKRSQTVNGERAYQVGNGGAHPADGFPCRVSLRK